MQASGSPPRNASRTKANSPRPSRRPAGLVSRTRTHRTRSRRNLGESSAEPDASEPHDRDAAEILNLPLTRAEPPHDAPGRWSQLERRIPPRFIPEYGNPNEDISTPPRRDCGPNGMGSLAVSRGHQRNRCRCADRSRASIISPDVLSALPYCTTDLGSSSTLRSHSLTGG